jgi:hypothetical protein
MKHIANSPHPLQVNSTGAFWVPSLPARSLWFLLKYKRSSGNDREDGLALFPRASPYEAETKVDHNRA